MIKNRRRLLLVAFFIFLVFSSLILQFFKLQIVEGERWTKEALNQHQLLVKDPFRRGLFYSNVDIKPGHPGKQQPLVIDIPKFHLFIDPKVIPESCHTEMISYLKNKLQLTNENEIANLQNAFTKRSRSRKLFSWMEPAVKDEIYNWWRSYYKEHRLPRNALYFIEDYLRSYPFGKLFGQVLSSVRADRDPKTGKYIPIGGLELYFHKELEGKNGKRLLLRSPSHPLDTDNILEHPENGADIYLTINHYLQAIVEEQLQKGVERAKAKGGWAVMLDPFSGEVLALAQYPFFEPGNYREYFNNPELVGHTRIKAVCDSIEPGSIFKGIMMTLFLKANCYLKERGEEPIFDPEEMLNVKNTRFRGRTKPILDLGYYDYMNFTLAIQKSGNVYPSRIIEKIADRLGANWIRSQLQEIFGFGFKTGIEIPSESPGMLPTPGKLHPNGTLEWSVPTPYSLVLGHNMRANSLQILKAYAIIVNGGYDVRPTLIKRIVKKGEVLLDKQLELEAQPKRRVLEPEIAETMVRAMKYTTKPGGTGSRADIYGYTEGGKTGTSEKIVGGTYSDKLYISSFVGFAPAEHPRFILLVSVDEPEKRYIPGKGKTHMGGYCAAPIFAEIASRALHYMGIAPDDPYGYPKGDPRYDRDKADWYPEVDALKDLFNEWHRK